MERVQTNQRVIGRSKEIRRDRQPMFINQPVPFPRRAEQKEAAKKDRQRPQTQEAARLPRSRDLPAKWTVMLLDNRQIV